MINHAKVIQSISPGAIVGGSFAHVAQRHHRNYSDIDIWNVDINRILKMMSGYDIRQRSKWLFQFSFEGQKIDLVRSECPVVVFNSSDFINISGITMLNLNTLRYNKLLSILNRDVRDVDLIDVADFQKIFKGESLFEGFAQEQIITLKRIL